MNGTLSGVFAIDRTQNVFVSYDTPDSVTAKAKYVQDKNLGGVMFWALRYDLPTDNPNSLLLAVDKYFGITPEKPVKQPELPNEEGGSVEFINNNGIALGLNHSIEIIAVEVDNQSAWIRSGWLLPSVGKNAMVASRAAFANYTGKLEIWTVNTSVHPNPIWGVDYRKCSQTLNYTPNEKAIKIYSWNTGTATDCAIVK